MQQVHTHASCAQFRGLAPISAERLMLTETLKRLIPETSQSPALTYRRPHAHRRKLHKCFTH
eukprot:6427966-Pyramimonas_sp.AAC.1